MIDVSQLLNKFRSLVNDKSQQKNIITEVIKESSGVSIDRKSIILNGNNSITINCHPVLKSEIFLRKESNIEALNKKLEPQRFEELL